LGSGAPGHFGPSNFKDGLIYNWDPQTGNVIVPQSALSKISPLYPVIAIKVGPRFAEPLVIMPRTRTVQLLQ
jgi:hypothetical protein